MAKSQKDAIIDVVKALVFAAGMASAVAQADIRSAAATLARQYGVAQQQQIEAEITRRIRNGG